MLKTAIRAVRKAGKLCNRYYARPLSASFSGSEVVSSVDLLVERAIRSVILSSFPSHSFRGEEEGDFLTGSRFCWNVDPIDGTRNFVRRSGYFSVSVSLSIDDVAVLSVVFNPLTEELFFAQRGRGAFLNGRRISVSSVSSLSHSTVFVSKFSKSGSLVSRFGDGVGTLRITGSSSYDMCLVACGRADAFIRLSGSPWRLAAGALIVEEAGGVVSEIGGSGWDINSGDVVLSNKLIFDELIGLVV